jgi:hypothetical protein
MIAIHLTKQEGNDLAESIDTAIQYTLAEVCEGQQVNKAYASYLKVLQAKVITACEHEKTGGLTIGDAIGSLKAGMKVKRKAWKDVVYLFYQHTSLETIDVKTSDNRVTSWIPSKADILADDLLRCSP